MRCVIEGADKPMVWKDEDGGWKCDQATICRTCKSMGMDRLAEDATWSEAMTASKSARPTKEQP